MLAVVGLVVVTAVMAVVGLVVVEPVLAMLCLMLFGENGGWESRCLVNSIYSRAAACILPM